MSVKTDLAGARAQGSSKYVVLCCFVAAIGGFSFGYDQGVISVILVMPRFLHAFPRIDSTGNGRAGFWKGLATSMLELGGVLGSLCQSWIADKFSRLRAMQAGVVVFIVGAIIQTAAHDYATLVVGRFIGGFGVGMLALVAPVYMGEISPAEIRGSLLVLEEWCIVVGAIVAFWTTYGTRFIGSQWSFRLPFMLQIFPVLLLGVAAFWLPQSPRWYASKGRDQEALRTLSKLRGLPQDHELVLAEWYDIVADSLFHRQILSQTHSISEDRRQDPPVKTELAAFFDLFRRNCWRRTSVGVALVFFQQFVGINALIYYAPTIFSSIGLGYNLSLTMAGVMNIIQLVGVSLSIPLMDRVGRKPLLIFGSIGMLASQLCLSIVVGLYSDSWKTHSAQGWVGVAFIFWYMIAFGISWGPVPWSMPAEVYPSSLRAKGTAFTQACQWNIGYGTYVFFAVFCLLSAVWSWILCPETKGKTLEQMDELFKDHHGQQDEERKHQIRDSLVRDDAKAVDGIESASSVPEKSAERYVEVV